MPVSGITATILGTAAAGVLKLVFGWLQRRVEAKKWDKAYKASAPQLDAPPAPVFEAARPAREPQVTPRVTLPDALEVDTQRIHVKHVLLEAELAEAQQALRRLRRSLDDVMHELAEAKAELVVTRQKYDALQEASEALRQENEVLRREGSLNESRHRPDVAAPPNYGLGRGRERVHLPPSPGARRPEKGGKY